MILNCGVGEDSWESLGLQGDPPSPSWRKSVLNIHWKDLYQAETPILWPPGEKNWHIREDPDSGKDWRQQKGTTEDEMVGWHQRLNGHEFEQTPGVGDGQGGLACYSPWGRKESDMTVTELNWLYGCGKQPYVWFSFHLGCHRSAVSLSYLNVSPLTQTIAPMRGFDLCIEMPPPAEGRSSPTNTPVFSPSPFILLSFVKSISHFHCIIIRDLI